jgi:ABC-type lipoprotein release transport system permease subunit
MGDVITLDVTVFLTVTPMLAMISLAAAYVPARRALRLDPAEVLRR